MATKKSAELESLLLHSNSKYMCNQVVNWIGDSPTRFSQLLFYVQGSDKLLQQRAVYPLSFAIEAHPELIEPHYKILLELLRKDKLHETVRRNILRALEYAKIPEQWQGLVMDACFQFITDPQEKPATKASAITVLGKLSKIYPEIIPEIKTILETSWDQESPAFRARAKKVFKTR